MGRTTAGFGVALGIVLLGVAFVGVPDARAADDENTAVAPSPTPRKLTPQEEAIQRKILVHIEADPEDGPPPLKVKFSPDFYYENEERPSFTWTFGDGTAQSHQRNPTHTYKKAGKYKVTLYVTAPKDRAGGDDSTINVDNPEM